VAASGLLRAEDVGGNRVAALDGLRGVAAVVVVVGHLLLFSSAALSLGFLTARPAPHLSGWDWALLYTPLHILWTGPEAVIVFFVLSGYVLTRPTVGKEHWLRVSYFPRRLARLYLPVWGALILAFVFNRGLLRTAFPGWTWSLGAVAGKATTGQLGHAAVLVLGSSASQQLDPVIWSLRWEVIFSMLLPFYVLLARATQRRLWLAALGTLACLAVIIVGGKRNDGAASYLPVFLLGSLLAYHADELRRRCAKLFDTPRWGRPAGVVALAVALLALTSEWWLRPTGLRLPLLMVDPPVSALLGALVALGALLFVLLAMTVGDFAVFLTSRPVAWAGSRSYSLYLVHAPFVATLAFAWGGHLPVLPYVAAGLVGSLILAELFFRVVEHPAHLLSRHIGRLVDSWTAPARTSA
jgi:peptidoglycan/LPS O-acetylase OafA/YrhL